MPLNTDDAVLLLYVPHVFHCLESSEFLIWTLLWRDKQGALLAFCFWCLHGIDLRWAHDSRFPLFWKRSWIIREIFTRMVANIVTVEGYSSMSAECSVSVCSVVPLLPYHFLSFSLIVFYLYNEKFICMDINGFVVFIAWCFCLCWVTCAPYYVRFLNTLTERFVLLPSLIACDWLIMSYWFMLMNQWQMCCVRLSEGSFKCIWLKNHMIGINFNY